MILAFYLIAAPVVFLFSGRQPWLVSASLILHCVKLSKASINKAE